jgi:hypothetical protein
VALPVREQRDVDVMGDGPITDIDDEGSGVSDELPRYVFVVEIAGALRVTGRDCLAGWSPRVSQTQCRRGYSRDNPSGWVRIRRGEFVRIGSVRRQAEHGIPTALSEKM